MIVVAWHNFRLTAGVGVNLFATPNGMEDIEVYLYTILEIYSSSPSGQNQF